MADLHPELFTHGTFHHLPLGRCAPRHDPRTLKLAKYLDKPALPSVPATVDYTAKVPSWPMYSNDSFGNCLLPGTLVVAPHLRNVFRTMYEGPAVEIVTESGKRLSVTSNHPILTARGFVRAHELSNGDYLLSSNRAESVPVWVGDDLNHVPTPIEDIFATYHRIGAAVSQVGKGMYQPVDFHGDAQFFDGEIDIVDTDGLLNNGYISDTSQVEGHNSLVLAGEFSQSFHSGSAPLAHSRSIPLSSPRGVGAFRAGESLLWKHVLVSQDRSLTTRPYLYATGTKPSSDDFAIDSELPGELLGGCPGLITTDRVSHVRHFVFRGHVFDLSTDTHWYIADGIFTHNCTCAAAGHMIEAWTANAGKEVVPDDNDVLNLYWATGNPPNHPCSPGGPTDTGRVELDVLKAWQKTGLGTDRIVAFVQVNPANLDEVHAALFLFGGIYAGVALPVTAQHQTVWDVVGDGKTGDSSPGSWGGHAIPLLAYDGDGFTCVTWGATLKFTTAFFDTYLSANVGGETWAVLSQDWLTAQGTSIAGFDLAQLQADLAAVSA